MDFSWLKLGSILGWRQLPWWEWPWSRTNLVQRVCPELKSSVHLLAGHSRIGLFPHRPSLRFSSLVMYVLIQKHKFGYHLYALGGNRIAAQIAGIRVQNRGFCLHACRCPLFLCSICLTGTLSGSTPLATETMVNDTILAVFIGSSVSKRKVINIPGTFLGVIIMGIFSNGLALIGVPSYWMQLVKGILIILVIVTSSRSEKMVQI